MTITATHINYYHLCHRKLWLFHNGIQMEHTSGTVLEGKLIGENTYMERAGKYTELEMDGIKIDYYDAKSKVVHEVKKSNKVENAHLAQVKYYLYVLEQNGIEGVSGKIEYPTLRKTEIVPTLTDKDKIEIKGWVEEIEKLVSNEACPQKINKNFCKKCSYFDFCWSGE